MQSSFGRRQLPWGTVLEGKELQRVRVVCGGSLEFEGTGPLMRLHEFDDPKGRD